MSKSSKVEKKIKEDEIKSVLVSVNRVSKVVKGGRRFGFSVIVVAGNQKGQVGYGLGKAKEVMEAKTKADQAARKNMISVNLKEKRTIYHDIKAKSGAGLVLLKSAPSGKGIIAGGPMRAIFECLGVHDVVSKCLGSTNPHNMIAATFEALKSLSSPKEVAIRRGKKVTEIVSDVRN